MPFVPAISEELASRRRRSGCAGPGVEGSGAAAGGGGGAGGQRSVQLKDWDQQQGHGWHQQKWSWIDTLTISGLVDLLARNRRVICFDRPGFGHSQRTRSRLWTATAQADFFARVLAHLGVRNPVIFGHSWATLVAVALALRQDYPIRGLALASGYYFPTPRWDVWMMSGPAIPIVGDLLRYTIAPIISWAMLPGIFRKLFAPRSVPEPFKNEFPTSLTVRPKQLKAAAEESAFLIPVTAQFQSQYEAISCPVHIFHGRDDQVIEPEQSRRLHKAIGQSVLHIINDGGHMITHAEPHGLAQVVTALK
jgi:pimeloyl-ACP methyl ester carboxylesterase